MIILNSNSWSLHRDLLNVTCTCTCMLQFAMWYFVCIIVHFVMLWLSVEVQIMHTFMCGAKRPGTVFVLVIFLILCQPVKYVIHAVIGTRPNFPYTKYMYGGYERPHKSGRRPYPYVKKSFKTQHGRIPIDPAILAAIGHRFIAKTKKTKNADWDQKPETHFWPQVHVHVVGMFSIWTWPSPWPSSDTSVQHNWHSQWVQRPM